MNREVETYVCPSVFAGSLDNSLRRWIQNPNKILKPFVTEGMTVLDFGCGPGVFTLELARLVQKSGKVIAADLQNGMLDIVAAKVRERGLEQQIILHKCEKNSIGIAEKVDFILAFWMIHEVPDHHRLMHELKSILKPGGKLFIVEPKMHVSNTAYEKMTAVLLSTGFKIIERPKVFFSRAILSEY